jgi:hypothetical protein
MNPIDVISQAGSGVCIRVRTLGQLIPTRGISWGPEISNLKFEISDPKFEVSIAG